MQGLKLRIPSIFAKRTKSGVGKIGQRAKCAREPPFRRSAFTFPGTGDLSGPWRRSHTRGSGRPGRCEARKSAGFHLSSAFGAFHKNSSLPRPVRVPVAGGAPTPGPTEGGATPGGGRREVTASATGRPSRQGRGKATPEEAGPRGVNRILCRQRAPFASHRRCVSLYGAALPFLYFILPRGILFEKRFYPRGFYGTILLMRVKPPALFSRLAAWFPGEPAPGAFVKRKGRFS